MTVRLNFYYYYIASLFINEKLYKYFCSRWHNVLCVIINNGYGIPVFYFSPFHLLYKAQRISRPWRHGPYTEMQNAYYYIIIYIPAYGVYMTFCVRGPWPVAVIYDVPIVWSKIIRGQCDAAGEVHDDLGPTTLRLRVDEQGTRLGEGTGHRLRSIPVL